jgi:hypothetical protein
MPNDLAQPAQEMISFKEFLESIAPGQTAWVKDVARQATTSVGAVYHPLTLPVIDLHCDHEHCDGFRLFATTDTPSASFNGLKDIFVNYVCRNCRITRKTYALGIFCKEDPAGSINGNVYKYGEYPRFGPPTPARVITILGPEKEYYLKGRRAEFQGMGIGAYSYYRRVVENQRNRLLDEIIRVAQKIGASQDMLDDLNKAREETQFTKAVERIRHGLPPGLLVNGHNPLTLLHKALSEGLHAQTDEECLALATDIRVVLADLADRLGHALKDRAELDAAVSRLMK